MRDQTPSAVFNAGLKTKVQDIQSRENLLRDIHRETSRISARSLGKYYCETHTVRGLGPRISEIREGLLRDAQREGFRISGSYLGRVTS